MFSKIIGELITQLPRKLKETYMNIPRSIAEKTSKFRIFKSLIAIFYTYFTSVINRFCFGFLHKSQLTTGNWRGQ